MDKRGKKRAERHVSAALRMGVAALTLLLQIARYSAAERLSCGTMPPSSTWRWSCRRCAVAIGIFNRSGSPSYKVSWMLLVLAVPVAGIILYVLWGGNHQAKHLSLKRVAPARRAGEHPDGERGQPRSVWAGTCPNLGAAGRLRCTSGAFSSTATPRCGISRRARPSLPTWSTGRPRRSVYIFLEYYILAEGKLWDRLFEVLQRALCCRGGGQDHL